MKDYENYENNDKLMLGTGDYEDLENYKFLIYPFNKYEIKIILSPNNEFLGISEIKINKSFLNYKQKISRLGYHDVEQFYTE